MEIEFEYKINTRTCAILVLQYKKNFRKKERR